MLLTLFIIPIVTLIVLGVFWTLFNNFDKVAICKPNYNKEMFRFIYFNYFKSLTLTSLFFTLFYSLYLWKDFPKEVFNIDNLIFYPSLTIMFGNINLFEISHNLNLPFIILSTTILIIALLANWYSNINQLFYCVILLLIEVFLIGAFSCSNIFVFLLFFESSALPIFILIAYCGSARRERLKASYYFLFFTLYGSLSLLLLILNFYSLNQIAFTDEVPLVQSNNYVLWLLLFIAFAVKIPLFPFHIWLPYAHVEASTSTSIILAALMLKLGGYGVIKFMLPLFTIETHLFFRPLALLVCVFGVAYASLCALRQIDLKRQIAFSSVAHMSFATIGVFTFTEIGVKGSIYLMLSHGLTSAALFFLVGVLSDRYHTRSIMAFSGLLSTMPLFSFFLIFMSLANVGFPGTSGFLPELFVVISVVSSVPAILFPTLLGMLLTTATTLIILLRILFGHSKVLYFKSSWIDLTKLEFTVLAILSIWVLIIGLYDVLNWI